MEITWYGHACFALQSALRIVTDPYTPEVANLRPVPQPADIVIMSSDDDDFHSCAAAVPGQPEVLDALQIARGGGARTAQGMRVEAIEARESVIHKVRPDANALYALTVEGLRIAHLGDVGNPLTAEQLAFLRGTDILLALTGGPPTIELDDLAAVLEAVRPRIVIPMHYRIPNLRLNILPLEAFTERFPAERVALRPEATLVVTRERLPEQMQIVVLQPAANLASYPDTGPAWQI